MAVAATNTIGAPWQHSIAIGNHWGPYTSYLYAPGAQEGELGDPIDLTGSTIVCEVRYDQKTTVTTVPVVITNATAGEFTVGPLLPAQTQKFRIGMVVILALVDANGYRKEIARGPIIKTAQGI